jgi:hypothetical protein
MNRECCNIIVRNCQIHDNWGEGIGAYWHSHHITIENNKVFNNKVNIYVSFGRHFYIHDNLVFGTSDDRTHWESGDGPGRGIVVNDEDHWDEPDYMSYIYVYRNYIAYCSLGIGFNKNGVSPGSMDEVKIFNNTIIACLVGMKHWHSNGEPAYSGNEVRNNLIWTMDSDKPSIVQSNHIVWSNNNWYPNSGNIDPDCISSTDSNIMPSISKQSGWKSMTDGESITKADFFIVDAGSDLIDKGAVVESLLDDSNINLCWVGSLPDIGADEYGDSNNCGSSDQVLLPPVLSIVTN